MTGVLQTPAYHEIFGSELTRQPAGSDVAYLAMGCFWGAEKLFWQLDGVRLTAVGYMGGESVDPTYEQVCSGRTLHAEAVKVCYDPQVITYEALLRTFFENHDPTQGMRQGNDIGTQYRSAIFTVDDAQRATAERVRDAYQAELTRAGYRQITTEIAPAGEFYYAEAYHQQYLDKNPNGYCPVHATGVCFAGMPGA